MRNVLKKCSLLVLAPVVFVCLLELVLRIVQFGHDPDFLISSEVDGRPAWVENPFFTYSIFDPPLARIPAPIVALKDRPSDMLRIVVLGESAAMGDPIPDFGVSRVLEYGLRHADPEAKVEVINAAITAINSHSIKQLARELPKLTPDVVILYIGNNEVIGPFGPGTTFSGYLHADFMIDAVGWVNRLRIGQFIRMTAALVKDRMDAQEFGGVGMFIDHPVRADDPRLEAVRRRYENNLRSIISSARKSGARVIVSTIAVNREDCPPSISMNRPDLSSDLLIKWQAGVDRGLSLAGLKKWPDALRAFESASRLDDQHAGLQFWLATCLRETGRVLESRDHFDRAMNLDAFRYRADDHINQIALKAARESGAGVTVVDAASAFRRFDGLSDVDLFIDHVHFSFEGTARLASVWMEAITALPVQAKWTNQAGFPSTGWLKNELMYSAVAEISVAQEMVRRYSKPPFTMQVGHTAKLRVLRESAERLNQQLRSGPAAKPLDAFRERLTRYPDDLYFAMHGAQQMVAMNRFSEAWPVAEAAMKKHSHRRGPRSVLAHLLSIRGRAQEAADVLFDYEPAHGYFAAMSASYVLGVLTSSGYHTEAVDFLEAAREKAGRYDYVHRIQQDAQNTRAWRDAIESVRQKISLGQLTDAERMLASLQRARPDLGDPMIWLGVIEGMRGNPERGSSVFRQGLERLNYLQAHYFAGLWEARSERFNEARSLLHRAAELAGDDIRFVCSLTWIFAADSRTELRDPARARNLMEGLLTRDPGISNARVLDTYAAACASTGDFETARTTALRAFEAAQRENNSVLASAIKTRIDRYVAGQSAAWDQYNGPLFFF